jgi:hypothetical protein
MVLRAPETARTSERAEGLQSSCQGQVEEKTILLAFYTSIESGERRKGGDGEIKR